MKFLILILGLLCSAAQLNAAQLTITPVIGKAETYVVELHNFKDTGGFGFTMHFNSEHTDIEVNPRTLAPGFLASGSSFSTENDSQNDLDKNLLTNKLIRFVWFDMQGQWNHKKLFEFKLKLKNEQAPIINLVPIGTLNSQGIKSASLIVVQKN